MNKNFLSSPMWEDIFKAKDHNDRVKFAEENLQSYILLFIEKELLDELDAEAIIGRLKQSSNEHKWFLLI